MALRNSKSDVNTLEKAEAMDQKKEKYELIEKLNHEARTELNSIIGFTEMIEDELVGEINSEQKDAMHEILESAKRLLTIINQKFEIESKSEQGSTSSCIHSKKIN